MDLEQTQQKIKIRIDKNMWDILSGQIVMQRKTSLPVFTVGLAPQSSFNAAAKSLLDKAGYKFANFYKLSNGMLLIEFVKQAGQLKITRFNCSKRGIYNVRISTGALKKYIFNELNNKKLTYHFYLHPTDRENVFMLKELTNSWE